MQKPGKETIRLSASLSIAGKLSDVQVVFEKGGKVLVTSAGQSVKFDGAMLTGALGSGRELVESLADDSVENFMSTITEGAAARALGRRYPMGDGTYCDFFDLYTPSLTDPRNVRLKRYCFDSTTALLRSVQYRMNSSPSSPIVETRFEDWRTVQGQAIPGRILRREGGVVLFTLQAQTVGLSARGDDFHAK